MKPVAGSFVDRVIQWSSLRQQSYHQPSSSSIELSSTKLFIDRVIINQALHQQSYYQPSSSLTELQLHQNAIELHTKDSKGLNCSSPSSTRMLL
jgi:hypothetical protein